VKGYQNCIKNRQNKAHCPDALSVQRADIQHTVGMLGYIDNRSVQRADIQHTVGMLRYIDNKCTKG
jgi:hypothetical protein